MMQGETTGVYYNTRGALLKQLMRVLEYQNIVNTKAILSYRTMSFSPDEVLTTYQLVSCIAIASKHPR
jgi:hypothetical protein